MPTVVDFRDKYGENIFRLEKVRLSFCMNIIKTKNELQFKIYPSYFDDYKLYHDDIFVYWPKIMIEDNLIKNVIEIEIYASPSFWVKFKLNPYLSNISGGEIIHFIKSDGA